MCGSTRDVIWKTLVRFVWMTASHSSGDILASDRSRVIPALLTSASIFPKRSTTFATAFSTASASWTSQPNTNAVPPLVAISAATCSAASSLLTKPTATDAPQRPSSSAIARPMPRDPPVTRQALPFRSVIAETSSVRAETEIAGDPVAGQWLSLRNLLVSSQTEMAGDPVAGHVVVIRLLVSAWWARSPSRSP